MGRLEKIVVLTVLFLVAVILAVSLNRDEAVAGPTDLLAQVPEEPVVVPAPVQSGKLLSATAEDAPEVAPVAPAAQAEPVEAAPATTPAASPIVPAEEQPQAPAAEPEPAAPRPLLRTSEGLEPSLVPELRLYTWQEGDTFTSVADRYYGSRLEVARLRTANEGRDESTLRPGEKIFVPVEQVAAAERLGRSSADAGEWHGGVYVVESGDMLSKIAQTGTCPILNEVLSDVIEERVDGKVAVQCIFERRSDLESAAIAAKMHEVDPVAEDAHGGSLKLLA